MVLFLYNIGVDKVKVKFIGKTESSTLTNGEIYDVLSVESGWYRIVDKTKEDYLYQPELFEIVEE